VIPRTEPGTLTLELAFLAGSLSGEVVAGMLEEVRFPLHTFSLDSTRKARSYKPSRDLAALMRESRVTHVGAYAIDDLVRAEYGPKFSVSELRGTSQVVWWQAPVESMPTEDEVAQWARLPGFCVGICACAMDTRWQSETEIVAYERAGRDHSNLPKVERPAPLPPKLDVSDNPGRRELVNGFPFQAAWKMWFGPSSGSYIPPERLLSFPHARRAEKSGDLIFIQLYEDPLRAAEEREVQRLFRAWTGMDTLKAREAEFVDPKEEIQLGSFPHGGDRLLITWIDAGGKTTNRSKAVGKRVVECRSTGEVMWSGTISASN
jgi:hypothetical protein